MNPEIPRASDDDLYVPPSRWPSSFGVIAIVFGVFGLFSSLSKIVQYIMFGSGFMGTLYQTGGAGTPAEKEISEMVGDTFSAMEKAVPQLMICEIVLGVLALALMTGGILLLMRRRSASWLLQGWAVLKIIGGGFGAYLSWQMMGQIQAGIFAGATSPTQVIGIVYKVMFLFQLAWLAALPVVFLIWLNREAIRNDMAGSTWK